MTHRRHVCHASIHPFIRATEGAQLRLHPLHQPESCTALLPARTPADRAIGTNLGQHQVNPRWCVSAHFRKIFVCRRRSDHQPLFGRGRSHTNQRGEPQTRRNPAGKA